MELLALIVALLCGGGLLAAVELRERPALQTVELKFGTDLNTDLVQALVASVAGLPSTAVVAVETVADSDGISHFLTCDQAMLDTLRGQWRGLLPSLRLDSAEDRSQEWSAGAALRLGGRYPVLRDDGAAQAAASLLGALQPLGENEALLWRVVLAPVRRPRLPEPASPAERRRAAGMLGLLSAATPRADHLRALRVKYAGPLVSAVVIVAVRAGHPKRAAHLLSRLASVARSRRGAYGGLVVRRRSERRLARLLSRRSLRRGDLYSPPELAALIGLPIDGPQIAGLSLGTAPVLMPSPRIPTSGRVMATSTWPGSDRLLAQPVVGGLSHSLLAGPSGVGKSSLIHNLSAGEMAAGRGLLVIDGKGDLAGDLLGAVPERRQKDVIVLDPGGGGPVPGLRMFGRGESAELTADLILGILGDLYADSWGPLSARWLRAGLVLLGGDPAATLADFPFIFTDDAYRRRLVARLSDPLAEQIWSSFEAMGAAERAHQLAAPLNKIEEIIGRRTVRAVLAQSAAEAKLDMRAVLAGGKIVILSLAPGTIGAPAARLLGALVIHELFVAVQARAALPPERRTPFSVFVDEPKVLGDVSRNVPLDGLYELARGMGVGVTLSVQSLVQLPKELRAAATTNAATVVAFRQSADDSRILAAELPGVSSEGLQNLDRFHAIMRIGLGPGDVAPPVSGRTFPPPAAISDPETVRRISAERYGTDPARVDAALAERHKPGGTGARPVGRSRRSS